MHTFKLLPGSLLAILLLLTATLHAQKVEDSAEMRQQMINTYLDSFEKTINYEHGKVKIKEVAVLDVSEQYKFIPANKATEIIVDLWGNPKRDDILGMLVAADYTVSKSDAWAFVITYDEDGFVKDEDADKINYDNLLKEIQKDEEETNKKRIKNGYPPIHMLAWAERPYYDKDKKVLHWAKKLQFGDTDPSITLNYDVRVLGRKGILSLNAVGSMDQLQDINQHIPEVLKMATFTSGNTYKDFDPSIDKVAAYTIGGLIAGKLIAKTGILLLLLKNIKLILLAVFGGFAAFRKKIAGWFGRKKKDDYTPTPPAQQPWDVESPATAAAIEAPVVEATAASEGDGENNRDIVI